VASSIGEKPIQCQGGCSAVQCSAVQCSAVQCSAVQCSAVQGSAVQCSAVQALQCRGPGASLRTLCGRGSVFQNFDIITANGEKHCILKCQKFCGVRVHCDMSAILPPPLNSMHCALHSMLSVSSVYLSTVNSKP
jgi:hypothetical protein